MSINLSNNNFTVEFWLYLTISSSGLFNQTSTIISYLPTITNFYIGLTSNIISCYIGTTLLVNGKIILVQYKWYHIAVVRLNTSSTISVYSIYINGILDTSATTNNIYLSNSSSNITSSTNIYRIGNFGGLIDEIRITNNIARYTGNFVPQVQGFSTAQSFDYLKIQSDPYYSYVTLLYHFNNSLIDYSYYTNSLTSQIM